MGLNVSLGSDGYTVTIDGEVTPGVNASLGGSGYTVTELTGGLGGAPVTVSFDGTTFTANISPRLTGTPTYQWQRSADNSNWSNISGQTSSTKAKVVADEGNYVRVLVSALQAASAGALVPVPEASSEVFTLVQTFPVRQCSATLANTQRWYFEGDPITVGNSLVIFIKPNPSGEVHITSCTDDTGRVWTQDFLVGDFAGLHAFHIDDVTEAPAYVDIVTDGIGMNTVRMYGVEVSGCPDGIELVAGSRAVNSFTSQTGQSESFDALSNTLMFQFIAHTSGSRYAIPDEGTTLMRLLETGPSGTPGTEFLAQVSEQAGVRLETEAGTYSVGLTWADGNNSSGYTTGAGNGEETVFAYRRVGG